MRVILAKNWWSLLIRGTAAVVLGAVAVVWRDISLGNLILVFFGFALLEGVVRLAGALRAAEAYSRFAFGALLIALSFRLRSWARLALAES